MTRQLVAPEAPSLADQAVAVLRREIITGSLEPGSKVFIKDLAARFGSSPIPIREALRSLQAQGLIALASHRVAVVATASLEDMESTYWLRAELESLAAREACLRHDAGWIEDVQEAMLGIEQVAARARFNAPVWEDVNAAHIRFHQSIYGGAGSGWLTQFTATLMDASERYHHLVGTPVQVLLGSVESHRQIVHWLRTNDAEFAALQVKRHIQEAADHIRAHISDAPARLTSLPHRAPRGRAARQI